jgi:peptide deformylase
VDGKLVRLIDEMFELMYEAPGIGLAAPQVGVQKQLFVYDVEEAPGVLINPSIKESSGEWVYEEGCLSIPGLYVEIMRPKEILLHGWDLEGNEVEFEADEIMARLFQHELDHLHGVLMFDRMTPEQRKEAMAEYRRIQEEPSGPRKRRLRLQ